LGGILSLTCRSAANGAQTAAFVIGIGPNRAGSAFPNQSVRKIQVLRIRVYEAIVGDLTHLIMAAIESLQDGVV
jgi:hypothetical protein